MNPNEEYDYGYVLRVHADKRRMCTAFKMSLGNHRAWINISWKELDCTRLPDDFIRFSLQRCEQHLLASIKGATES